MVSLRKVAAVLTLLIISLLTSNLFSQNPLFIPQKLTGTNFNLVVQSGTKQFFTGNPTPTYGINGAFLSPTIVVNKGDLIKLNVINQLNVTTTMHWHGLHVSPENDGGPHQMIMAGMTWSPSFEILNNAGTYWYHPHGEGKTELHVGKGLAGLFIVHDASEVALALPSKYGIDDIPVIVQSKSFDGLNQVAIADHMDTAIFVNGTLNALAEFPAQVVRLRLLNGSSMRSFNFGFSNNQKFYQIASDGGLLEKSIELTRILLAPGERSEILVDLSNLNGQNFNLMNYGSEMPNGIFGSPEVGVAPDTIEMYDENPLNGTDYKLMSIKVVNQSSQPITTIPNTLVPINPFNPLDVDVNRRIVFDTITLVPGSTPNLSEGPFGMNNSTFSMDSINIVVPLNSTEIWTLVNKTHIAHPFHIHDIQFNILEKSGVAPPLGEQGWKDVVLVMPHDSVKFITKFTTFSDEMTPYMYHCHLLHHEDDGMMGSFLVVDPFAGLSDNASSDIIAYPNPSSTKWVISGVESIHVNNVELFNTIGESLLIRTVYDNEKTINIENSQLENGIYFLIIRDFENNILKTIKLEK